MHNVLRIVSRRKRFCLDESPIDFTTFMIFQYLQNSIFDQSVYLKYSNRSFINFIVAYLSNYEIHIFIIREQHALGFICIDAYFI